MSFTSNELRKAFIQYFVNRGHKHLPSSSLVPIKDQTLLFVNAGMNQFKDMFLNPETKQFDPIVTVQKCLRAGGKHNDLDMVGKTARHHTFFEMMGNFSFGFYWKEEAIKLAYGFLVEVVGLPKEKLFFSVFNDDLETKELWKKLCNVEDSHIFFNADNFWSMGDIGPCGPCTEIFYDQGIEAEEQYLEIWNIVFMQYNRLSNGKLEALKYGCIDTGMGLERLAAVSQQVASNYQTDILALIKQAIKEQHPNIDNDIVLNILADHIRAAVFLIADGVLPGNDGRNYILRRIIRRALNAALKYTRPYFYKLAKTVATLMGDYYSEILVHINLIEATLQAEESLFLKNLEQGKGIFKKMIAGLQESVIPGNLIFKMYDTYGIPLDIISDLAEQENMAIDRSDFDRYMEKQRTQSSKSSPFKQLIYSDQVTLFTGYKETVTETVIVATYNTEGVLVEQLVAGQTGYIITSATPLFPGGGGQAADRGFLKAENMLFVVESVAKVNNAILHIGYMQQGSASKNQKIYAELDALLRQQAAANHSATHLLHATLKEYLGDSVSQRGSLVTAHKLRFDFSCPEKKLTKKDITYIEDRINRIILENHPCIVNEISVEEAAKNMPDEIDREKHGDKIRIITIGNNISSELCCGTHVKRTSEIGLFKIVHVCAVAVGVRRIEAITSRAVLDYLREDEEIITGLLASLSIDNRNKIIAQINSLKKQLNQQKEELHNLQDKLFTLQEQQTLTQEKIGNKKLIYAIFNEVNTELLRKKAIHYKDHQQTVALLMSSDNKNNLDLSLVVSNDLQDQMPATKLASLLITVCGCRGGGNSSLVQIRGNSVNQAKIIGTIKECIGDIN